MRQDKNSLVVALVGYGYWGPNLLRNYMEIPEATVKWVCDCDASKQAKAKSSYPSVAVTEDYSDILRDPEVDAVLVATPISTHHDLAVAAINAGKHVFVEKPMTATTVEAEALVMAAEKHGVTLMVGHTFEYSAPVVAIRDLIRSGELGDIYYISSSRINLGLHQKDVSVICDLAPHDFSILFDWLGEEPEDVTAMGRGCIRSEIPDVAFVTLRFPSGTIAEMQLSWLSPVKLRRTLVVGSKKMLVYDDTESVEKVKVFDHGVNVFEPESFGEFQLSYRTGDIVSPHISGREPLRVEAEHFLECVREGKTPKTDGLSGLRVVRAIERAETSMKATV
ncbi:MAG: Gfo/Idh/MocA family oxidoreductase [Coriobacteriia bacterium]|nr:Gfo/Idh/MocA family oxidoreductase [Coriobacteriia bacterium]